MELAVVIEYLGLYNGLVKKLAHSFLDNDRTSIKDLLRDIDEAQKFMDEFSNDIYLQGEVNNDR